MPARIGAVSFDWNGYKCSDSFAEVLTNKAYPLKACLTVGTPIFVWLGFPSLVGMRAILGAFGFSQHSYDCSGFFAVDLSHKACALYGTPYRRGTNSIFCSAFHD